jgi:hypothetical protein
MTVIVTSKFDIYSSQNLLVTAGTRGTVIETVKPPQKIRFKIRFDTNPNPTDIWVSAEDITFLDGTLGIVKAILEGTTQVISSIEFPDFISNTEILIGDELPSLRTQAKISLSDGLFLLIVSNRVTGEISFSVGHTS